jgi:regulator of nucleoside diphosphate kinase
MSDASISNELIRQPHLLLSVDEYDRLMALARGVAASYSAANAQRLMDELHRANTVPSRWIPDDTVTMGAYVEYREDDTGRVRRVQLVYPHEADIREGRISVLSPVGVALIGLEAGQSINWPAPDGRQRRLAVLRVNRQPFEMEDAPPAA